MSWTRSSGFDACYVNGVEVDASAVSLEMRQDYIQLETMSDWQPDPKWTHTDKSGHFHAFDKDGKTPTLIARDEVYFCADCNDDHARGTLHCRLCGEEVEPRRVNKGPGRTSVPGERSTELVIPGNWTGQVSVRLVAKGIELFGHMTVELVEGQEAGDHVYARSTLFGELYRRKAAA